MKAILFSLVLAVALGAATAGVQAQQLDVVATFNQQVTGVAVTKTGRVFVCFPYWSDDHRLSVAELRRDGSLIPFPNEAWNRKDGAPGARWVCVQSVYVDDSDALWVLDAASPKMEGVVEGGAKLVKFDMNAEESVRTIPFDETLAPEKSYLNDVRVDTRTGHAYLTESGLGSLLVVDLNNGKVRRIFTDHPATKAEPNLVLVVDGMKPTDPTTGKTPQIHADGIALDMQGGYLYFHALTGHTMYRVKTEDLRNEGLAPTELRDRVENMGQTPAPDGMMAGENGDILLAAFENNSVVAWNPSQQKTETLLTDKRLQWPDSLAWGPDGSLYVTTSQIHRMPRFNGGKNEQLGPFALWRIIMPPGKVASVKR